MRCTSSQPTVLSSLFFFSTKQKENESKQQREHLITNTCRNRSQRTVLFFFLAFVWIFESSRVWLGPGPHVEQSSYWVITSSLPRETAFVFLVLVVVLSVGWQESGGCWCSWLDGGMEKRNRKNSVSRKLSLGNIVVMMSWMSERLVKRGGGGRSGDVTFLIFPSILPYFLNSKIHFC